MTPPGRPARRGRLTRFARTYVVAIIGLLLSAWLIGFGLSVLHISPFDYSGQPPTPATVAGYQLRYQLNSSVWADLTVDADGKSCGGRAQRGVRGGCGVLATNVDPVWVAAVAEGRLNTEDTPAFAAITWRAVLAHAGSVCERGGLLDTRLAGCQKAATAGKATFNDSGVTAVVSSP